MTKTEDIDPAAMKIAVSLFVDWEGPSAEEIARAIMAAKAEEREACASYLEGRDGFIPGTAVFAHLVSRNNMPCMSGDPRDRLHSHVRRNFDDATSELAAAIRNRDTV